MNIDSYNEELIKRYWNLFDEGKYDVAGELIAENANIWLPNTKEVIRGRDKFIAFNKRYPGIWRIKLISILAKDDMVITVTKVESEDQQLSFHATSFFTVLNTFIQEIKEYWGENGEPPSWRIEEALTERY